MKAQTTQTPSTSQTTSPVARTRKRGRAALAAALLLLGALAPLGQLPRAHADTTASNSVLDQQETATDGGYFDIGATHGFGQTFTAGITGNLDALTLPLGIEGATTGALTVQVFSVTGSGLPSGAPLATGTVLPTSVYTGSIGWTNVPLQSPAPVIAGKHYAFELTSQNPDGQRYLITGPPVNQAYAAGTLLNNNGYGWQTGNPSYGLDFETYVSPTRSPATTTLSSLSGPTTVIGQPVTLIATVQAQGSGAPAPTGNVVFLNINGQSMGVAALHTTGPGVAQATLTPALAGAGTYGALTAYYVGDNFTQASSSAPSPFSLVVQPGTFLNDTASGLIYSGQWSYSPTRGDGDYQDDEHYTTTNGASFGDYFTGTGVRVLGETNSGGGTDEVYVDGVDKGSISTVSADRRPQQVLYSISGLPSGTHEIKVVKTSGGYLEVDALAVVQ